MQGKTERNDSYGKKLTPVVYCVEIIFERRFVFNICIRKKPREEIQNLQFRKIGRKVRVNDTRVKFRTFQFYILDQ